MPCGVRLCTKQCVQGTCTEFRKHAAAYFNEVEKGQEVRIVRHGRTIATITPSAPAEHMAAWKRPSQRLFLKGNSVSSIILEERER